MEHEEEIVQRRDINDRQDSEVDNLDNETRLEKNDWDNVNNKEIETGLEDSQKENDNIEIENVLFYGVLKKFEIKQ